MAIAFPMDQDQEPAVFGADVDLAAGTSEDVVMTEAAVSPTIPVPAVGDETEDEEEEEEELSKRPRRASTESTSEERRRERKKKKKNASSAAAARRVSVERGDVDVPMAVTGPYGVGADPPAAVELPIDAESSIIDTLDRTAEPESSSAPATACAALNDTLRVRPAIITPCTSVLGLSSLSSVDCLSLRLPTSMPARRVSAFSDDEGERPICGSPADTLSTPSSERELLTLHRTLGDEQYTPIHEDSDTSPAPATEAAKEELGSRCTWRTFGLLFAFLAVFVEVSLLFADSFLDLPFDPPNPWQHSSSSPLAPVSSNSVYVPGAGFSGFWFTLGRLSSIPRPAERTYYCYSAGCLGAVAILSGRDMEEMYDLASGVQRRWQRGEISRYEVVGEFVDGLLYAEDESSMLSPAERFGGKGNGTVVLSRKESRTVNNSELVRPRGAVMDDPLLLSKIRVVTTTREWLGVRHDIRTPSSLDSLREMLVQTTWIPFATGESLWSRDSRTGLLHMDGAFSAPGHPKCADHLGLPFMLDLFLNTLNVNLGRDRVERYWSAGVERGL